MTLKFHECYCNSFVICKNMKPRDPIWGFYDKITEGNKAKTKCKACSCDVLPIFRVFPRAGKTGMNSLCKARSGTEIPTVNTFKCQKNHLGAFLIFKKQWYRQKLYNNILLLLKNNDLLRGFGVILHHPTE